ncbi:catalase, partial [Cribrihabitans sp. XS_ASV171]
MKTTRGAGGETHQQTTDRARTMTSAQGVPISDDQNSLRAGARGPGLLEDQMMREKIFHFDHERIPERVVHARGFGAKGHFELTDPMPELSCADIFQRKG